LIADDRSQERQQELRRLFVGTSLNRARRVLLALLPAMLLAVLALAAPPAHAAGGLDAAADALKKSPVYVDPRAASQLSSADAAALEKKIKDANKPVFVAVLPDSPEYPKATLLRLLRTKVGITGVYAVHLGDKGFNAGADPQVMSHSTISNALLDARSSASDVKTELNTFVDQADQVARGHAPDSWGDSGGSGGSGAAAGAIAAGVIVLGAGGGGYVLYRRAKKKKAERERAALDQLRTVVDEDITAFGEELERLDFSPTDPSATDAMRTDYTHALDAYDRAKSLMAAATRPDDVRPVTEALEDGHAGGPTQRRAAAGAPGAVLLRPAARALGAGRGVGARRWRGAQRSGVCRGRGPDRRRQRADDPPCADRVRPAAVLGRRTGLRAVGGRLLRRRDAAGAADRHHARQRAEHARVRL
jgi:hypothetical protein